MQGLIINDKGLTHFNRYLESWTARIALLPYELCAWHACVPVRTHTAMHLLRSIMKYCFSLTDINREATGS